MEPLPLSLDTLLTVLRETLRGCPDPRKPSNNTRYPLLDVLLGASSLFFMQNSSFL